MFKDKPTLAIYGIQDRFDYEHPFYMYHYNLALIHNGTEDWFQQQKRISGSTRDKILRIHLKSILKENQLLGIDYDLVFVDNVVGRTFLLQSGEPIVHSEKDALRSAKKMRLDSVVLNGNFVEL